jgi:predicted protein tyrosine phosphatase
MIFRIRNFHTISCFTSETPYAVISIMCPFDNFPELKKGYVDLLRLKFLDIDQDELCGYKGFDVTDANNILDFVEKNKSIVDTIAIHCNAGISRSSGVAAALSKIYNGDDTWVFKNRKYCPNLRVYSLLLKEALNRGLIN